MNLKLILIALVSILVLAQAPLKAGAGLSYYRYYFKEKQPLELDPSRIAVLERVERTAKGRFERFTIADEDVKPRVNKGWSETKTPASVRTAEDVEELVASMSRENAADFVSPMFFGESGGHVIFNEDIFVGFLEGVDAETAESIIGEADVGTILDRNYANMAGVYRLRSWSRNGFEVIRMANGLAERPEVKFAEPDGIFRGRGALTPNDPCFPECWGIHNTGQGGGLVNIDMDGPEAWDVTTGDPCIIVVIFDCGVDQSHPDIHQITGADFTGEGGGGGPVKANDNHGTAVAGCVSAIIDNGLGTVGIAPNCVIASARVYRTLSNGNWEGDASDVVDALAWAESIGAKVTNNSNIYFSTWSIIAQKYTETRANGIIHFAAAGNQYKSQIGWPASLTSVNAVTAINRYGTLWYQEYGVGSNWGTGLAFSAPGHRIWTTDRSGGVGYNLGDYYLGTGTSYASPYAAGVAALVLSCNQSLSPEQVEERMQHGCHDLGAKGYDTHFGWGLVNAYNSFFGTYYVDDNAPNDPGLDNPAVSDPCEDGSVDHPFDAIQEAIDVICGLGLVVVRDGTYTGTGNNNIDFGGKAITLRSQNGADVTIIDCENSVRGFHFHSGEGAESVVNGFKIINGFGAPGLGYGGGIWCAYSSPMIINCTISNCSAAISTSHGGGMSNFYCSPTVTNCLFSGNSSNWGGGMYNYESNPTVTNCTFKYNWAKREGGGIYNYDSNSATFINCTFNGNRADDIGGGMENIQWSEPTLINCTFSGNSASWGGGMFNAYSLPKLVNCTLTGNLADDYGGGIYNYSNSSQMLNNCIMWGNTATSGPEIYDDATSSSNVSYSDVQGGYTGTGNKDTDPCFLRVPNDGGDGWGDDPSTGGIDEGANDDFGYLRLSADSNCIDVGDNNASDLPATDFEGHPRIIDGDCNDTKVVDMGAYEFNYTYIGDFDYDCDVDFEDFAMFGLSWLSEPGDDSWNRFCDIGIPADDYIDWSDLDVFVDNWLAGK